MNRHTSLSLCAALALATGLPAQAASIALQPSATTVLQGQAFTLDLVIDAADVYPGQTGGLYGGEVIIRFDPAQVSFGTPTLAAGVNLYLPLASETAGGQQTLTFGFDNAPETGTVATLGFTAIGSAGATAAFDIEDNDDFSGSFAAYYPTYKRFDPAFIDTAVQISAVPAPGAAWLLATGVAGLGALGRRRRQAQRDS